MSTSGPRNGEAAYPRYETKVFLVAVREPGERGLVPVEALLRRVDADRIAASLPGGEVIKMIASRSPSILPDHPRAPAGPTPLQEHDHDQDHQPRGA